MIEGELRRVKLCRGCCCGVKPGQKLGAEDRAIALKQLEQVGIEVEFTDCLGPCEKGDIAVVLPTATERKLGHKPLWLGSMHSLTLTRLLAQFVMKDFPENLHHYPELQGLKIQPPRKGKKEVYEIKKMA
jgi:hypothetical protein